MSTAVLWEDRWVACKGYLCLLQCCCWTTGGWHVEDMSTAVLWEDRWVVCRGYLCLLQCCCWTTGGWHVEDIYVCCSVVVGQQVGGM